MFFYLQTRTRGVMMFARMETLQREASTLKTPDVSAPQFIVSAYEPSTRKIGGATPSAAPAPKDREILAAGPERLSTADQFAAFAAALVRNNDLSAGASAWMDAIKRDVDKARPEFRKRLAEVLFTQKRTKEALAALKDAIAAEQDPEAKLDLKRNALFNALYLEEPNSFLEAKPLSDELLASDKYGKDPWVLLWTIAALGQQAASIAKQPGADLRPVKDDVLKRIGELKAVTTSTSEQRVFLKRILDPSAEGGAPSENDLVIFNNDPEVRAAVEG